MGCWKNSSRNSNPKLQAGQPVGRVLSGTSMPSYNLSILGLELSFKTDAQPERIASASELVEQRYNMLKADGKTLGKEKLLAFVALGLADDVLMSNQRLSDLESRVGKLLTKID